MTPRADWCGRLVRHGTVDSTNERALASIAAGEARHGDWHLAEAQTAGRGRRGTRWQSPRGEGLFASVVLLPPPEAPPPPPALTMATGLGVLGALAQLGLAGARLKWPNDLLLGPAKLAGILVEARGLNPERPHFVVGIGLNVLQRRFPAELERERPVTSLALEGLATTVEQAFGNLRGAVEGWLDVAMHPDPADPGRLEQAYGDALGLVGGPVVVRSAGGHLTGTLLGLSLVGGLALGLPGGQRREIALEHVTGLEAG